MTILHQAIIAGDANTANAIIKNTSWWFYRLRFYLTRFESIINTPYKITRNFLEVERTTPLQLAVAANLYSTVALLLENGADQNRNRAELPPVYYAICDNNYEIAKLLIKKGANPQGLIFFGGQEASEVEKRFIFTVIEVTVERILTEVSNEELISIHVTDLFKAKNYIQAWLLSNKQEPLMTTMLQKLANCDVYVEQITNLVRARAAHAINRAYNPLLALPPINRHYYNLEVIREAPQATNHVPLVPVKTTIEKELDKLAKIAPWILDFDFPAHLCCPIGLKLMFDPVIVIDSCKTYDRAAISIWFNSHNSDPLTNVLVNKNIIPNDLIKEEILTYLQNMYQEITGYKLESQAVTIFEDTMCDDEEVNYDDNANQSRSRCTV